MPGGIGPLELAIVLVIVLVVFGPKRLPGLGRSLGSGMREFKESITGGSKDDDDETRDEPSAIAAPRDEETASDRSASEQQRDDAVSQPRG
ncbi:MAG: twin-arginine translocase TatA/TatE family subunit [Solirubrobacterales bacterium]|nr:twin-arginine translocase TatA/TatE family subunit [Solirubrobacterales bacterium]